MTNLFIFMSHPIQYQVSFLRKISKITEISTSVYFYWDFGVKNTFDPEFNKEIKWDIPLLNGYSYSFLKNYSISPNTSFFGCINWSVIRLIFSKKCDVVLIFGWAIFSNWLVIISAILAKKPIMMISEAPLSHEFSKSYTKSVIRAAVLKRLFKFVSIFLYIGQENLNFYKKFNVDDSKLKFCPYAVDNDRYIALSEEGKVANVVGEDPIGCNESIVLLYVGKLIKKKRPMDLILAFQRLLLDTDVNLKFELWFIGDGDQRPILENFIKNEKISSVKFFGFKNQSELPIYYERADIFILPSGVGETWGLVVNEAMCYSKPIIASSLVGCSADLVTPSNGFIYECGKIDQITECIKQLALDEEMRNNFGKESFNIVSKYNQDVAAKSVADAALSCTNK